MAKLKQFALMAPLVLVTLTSVSAQSRPGPKVSTAEYQLVGIKLYDPGITVIRRFGNPDEIQGINFGTGGGAAGPGGAAGGAGGGPTTPGGAGASAAQAQLSLRPGEFVGDPFSQGNHRQFSPEGGREGDAGSRPGAAGAGGAAGGGASQIADGAAATGIEFTRWVYKEGRSQYAFVMDRRNRVVQIEALGLTDAKVSTRRGTKFGSDFSALIRKYGSPENYEISGSNIVIKYLVKDKVAFRLSRTEPNKPHRVTGIVVAAAKG